MKVILKRQVRFLRHVMRRQDMENLCLTGKIQGTRTRRRQRTKYLAKICNHIKQRCFFWIY